MNPLPCQLVGATHAEPHCRPACDPTGPAVWHRCPMHAVVRQLNKPHRGPSQAAAANSTYMGRLRGFRGVCTRECPRRVITNFCVGSASWRSRGRGRIKGDAELLTTSCNARLTGQVVYGGTTVGAPSVQAGGLHQTAEVGEGAAARVGGLVHVGLGGRGFQANGARSKGRRIKTWGDVARHIRRRRRRRHMNRRNVVEGVSPVGRRRRRHVESRCCASAARDFFFFPAHLFPTGPPVRRQS